MGVGGEWDLKNREGGMRWCFCLFFSSLDCGWTLELSLDRYLTWQTTFNEVVSAVSVRSKIHLAAENLCGIMILPTWLKALTRNRRPCVRHITPVSITTSTNHAA